MSHYCIVSASTLSQLVMNVNAKVVDGWKPIGGLELIDKNCMAQAMVRTNKWYAEMEALAQKVAYQEADEKLIKAMQ